jgi:phosphohistidine phosphatase
MLFLVHHADAMPANADPRRPLSPDGRAHAERLAQNAAARGVRPALVWHSGKLRARQTAEAFWRTCNPFAQLAAVNGLQPSDPPQRVADLIAAETREIMLVGHMPNLPRVLSLLTGRDGEAVSGFPEHGLVALTQSGDRWVESFRLS